MDGGCKAGRDHRSWDKNVLSENIGDNWELITLYWIAVSRTCQGTNGVKPFHQSLPHSITEPLDSLFVLNTNWLLPADVETCIRGQRIGGPDSSKALQLKKAPANRKMLQKHTKKQQKLDKGQRKKKKQNHTKHNWSVFRETTWRNSCRSEHLKDCSELSGFIWVMREKKMEVITVLMA